MASAGGDGGGGGARVQAVHRPRVQDVRAAVSVRAGGRATVCHGEGMLRPRHRQQRRPLHSGRHRLICACVRARARVCVCVYASAQAARTHILTHTHTHTHARARAHTQILQLDEII